MLKNELQKMRFSGEVLENIPLGEKTGFKTGGLADYFIEPSDLKSLISFVKLMDKKQEKFSIIGGGTNILIKSSGIKYGLSLKKSFNSFSRETEDDKSVNIRVQSGTSLQKLCWHCAKKGFKGLNPLIGIPGSFGGALFMNAGTKTGDICSVIKEINILNEKGKKITLEKKDIKADYRALKIDESKGIKNYIILDALIELKKSESNKVYLEAKQLIQQRKETQPVKSNSCGCFFKNPSANIFAGRLIEKAGLKGTKIGGAKISNVHANFITSSEDASSDDIILLKNLVQKEVKKRFDILLEPEVKIVGR